MADSRSLPRGSDAVPRPESGVTGTDDGRWRWWVGSGDVEVSGYEASLKAAQDAVEIEIQNWWS